MNAIEEVYEEENATSYPAYKNSWPQEEQHFHDVYERNSEDNELHEASSQGQQGAYHAQGSRQN